MMIQSFIIICLHRVTEMPNIPSGPQMSFHTTPCQVNSQWSLPAFWGQLFLWVSLHAPGHEGIHSCAPPSRWHPGDSLYSPIFMCTSHSHLFLRSCYSPRLTPRSDTNLFSELQTYLEISVSFLLPGLGLGEGAGHRAPLW